MRFVFKLYYIVGLYCCIWLFNAFSAVSQDIQFSQPYANVTYLNPAFVGSYHKHRIIFHERYQWPRLDARYFTTYFSYDGYVKRARTGFGFFAYRDWQGGTKIVSNYVAAQAANELHLSQNLSLRLGLQIAYSNSTIDYSYFRYSQDFNSYGYVGKSYSDFGADMFSYIDVSAGTLMYSDKWWFGLAMNHMNRPTQTFYENYDNRLPMKTTMTGGYRFILKYIEPYRKFDKPIVYAIVPTAHYKMQGKSDQFDVGMYSQLDRLLLGAWYRGIIFKKYDTRLQNNESVALMAGFKFNDISIGYSYDFTISRLVKAQTGGAHELNITIYFDKERSFKNPHRFRTPCPDFFD